MNIKIKYISVIIGASIIIFFALALYSIIYASYSLFGAPNIEYYRGSLLINATVEVNGDIKTGQGIIEFSYNRRTDYNSGRAFIISPYNGVRGVLPAIDLGNGEFLVFTFTPIRKIEYPLNGKLRNGLCEQMIPSRIPMDVILFPQKYGYRYRDDANYNGSVRDGIKEIIQKEKNREKIDLKKYSLPVYFARRFEKKYPISKRRSIFCDIDTFTDYKIKPVSLTLEFTNLAITEQLKSAPEWLVELMGKSFMREEFKR